MFKGETYWRSCPPARWKITAVPVTTTLRKHPFLQAYCISKTELDWAGLVKRGLVKRGLVRHADLRKRGLVKRGLVKRGLVKRGPVKRGLRIGSFFRFFPRL